MCVCACVCAFVHACMCVCVCILFLKMKIHMQICCYDKLQFSLSHPIIIAERISARHWIADCRQLYVCMYVCPSRFRNAIKAQRMRDGNPICTANMHAYSPP